MGLVVFPVIFFILTSGGRTRRPGIRPYGVAFRTLSGNTWRFCEIPRPKFRNSKKEENLFGSSIVPLCLFLTFEKTGIEPEHDDVFRNLEKGLEKQIPR